MGVVSLSVFGGNFVLAKVRVGLISVLCTELRGGTSRRLKNVLVLWKNQSEASAFRRVRLLEVYCNSNKSWGRPDSKTNGRHITP